MVIIDHGKKSKFSINEKIIKICKDDHYDNSRVSELLEFWKLLIKMPKKAFESYQYDSDGWVFKKYSY